MPSNNSLMPQQDAQTLKEKINAIGKQTGGLADGLRNFGQSASNAIADQVAIPVDALAWLLRKGGVPVPPNPVGGSDWMREKGLTAPTQEGISKIGGELLGMVMPMGLNGQVAGQIAGAMNRGLPKNLPVGMSIRDVSGPQSEALALAQQRAALPVEKGGLGLPPNNTAADRAAAMGFDDGFMHGSPNPSITKFNPSPGISRGVDFGPATYATKSGDNASGYSLDWQQFANHPQKAVIEEQRQEILNRFLKAKQNNDLESASKIRQELNYLRDGDQLYDDFINYRMPSEGSTVYPLSVRTSDLPSVLGEAKNFREVHPSAISNARNAGAQGVLIRDVADNSGRFSGSSDVAAIFNPDIIRSRFAAFDPWRASAATAALYGVAAPDLLAAESQPRKKK